jgi:hypothetical protein
MNVLCVPVFISRPPDLPIDMKKYVFALRFSAFESERLIAILALGANSNKVLCKTKRYYSKQLKREKCTAWQNLKIYHVRT